MARPRNVYVIKTQHFDILFPSNSASTANLLAENADSIYQRAKDALNFDEDLRMPVIISPDSDKLSVEYTSSPYNRIIIYDAVPGIDDVCFEYPLLSLFFHEVFSALASSVKSGINKYIKIESYQPLSTLNLPFSFIEGFSYYAEDYVSKTQENSHFGRFNDGYFLQILSQAKLEGKFPNWIQASSKRDIYPGDVLSAAACSAFSAYLMQAYGVEKYIELWKECGNFHLFFMPEIFYKVYGKSISVLWEEFKDSVLLPDDIEEMSKFQLLTQKVFDDNQGLYEHILSTDFGLIWYDGIRHEVDIYDRFSFFDMRQLLFLADGIEKLSLSPDGKYLAVSYSIIKNNSFFYENKTMIYNIKERKFLKRKFDLRDSEIINLKDGSMAIVGVDDSDKIPHLKVFTFADDKDDISLIYEKLFSRTIIPFTPVGVDKGTIFCLVSESNRQSVLRIDVESGEEKRWNFRTQDDGQINIRNLRAFGEKSYSFEYVDRASNSFTRMGYFTVDEANDIKNVYLQSVDLSGGIYYPTLQKDVVYFCSKLVENNELRKIKFENLSFKHAEVLECKDLQFKNNDTVEYTIADIQKKYQLKRYNPFSYLIDGSIIPLFAIKYISIDEQPSLWPAVGFTLKTQSDPFMNNKAVISAASAFAKLSFSKVINPTEEEKRKMKHEELLENKNFSFSAFVENNSTPVDIRLSSQLNFNKKGEYDFFLLAGTFWTTSLRTSFNCLNFNVNSNWKVSTDYYDSNKVDENGNKNEHLENWPSFYDAYSTVEISGSAEYSNIHQYGLSKYEKRGFSFGARIFSFWDLYELKVLNKVRAENDISAGSKNAEKNLTKAQLEALYNKKFIEITQINLGLFGAIEIPRLNMFTIKNGWVFSMPSTIKVEILNRQGNALDASVQTMLLGNEIQNGLPKLYLYFSRFGLFGGYNIRLDYNTNQIRLPDIREKDYLRRVFSNTYLNDSVYYVLDIDFVAPIGQLSSTVFKFKTKGEYFLQSKEFKMTFDFVASF